MASHQADFHGHAVHELKGYAPAPRTALPFPSTFVASSDDPWIDINRARSLAVDWGSRFVDAGPQGHLNAASGIGWWPEGQELLERVIAASGAAHGRSLAPGDARAILLVNATDAAEAHYLGGSAGR